MVMLTITMEENNTTSPALKEWPGAFGLFKISREGVRENIGTLLALIVGLYVFTIVIQLVLDAILGKSTAAIVDQPVTFVIGIWFGIAFVRVTLACARSKRVEIKDTLTSTSRLFFNMLLLEILLTLSIVGGLILLIVPGIIIGCRLSLAQYYLVDRDMEAIDAYKASWNATRGHVGKPLGIAGVSLLMVLPVVTIIGIIATAYLLFMYSASGALLYLYLSKKSKASKAAV